MKKYILALIIAATSLSTVNAQSEVPATEVRTLQNKKVEFNSLFTPGKVTLVSFWATWCVPCKKEISNLKELLPSWKEEMDIDFFTVSTDDSRSAAKVASYAASQRWDFETYLDPNNDLKRSLNFQTVPFTLIVDAEGKIAYMHNGYEEGAENEIYEKLKELTASAAPEVQEDTEGAVEESPRADVTKRQQSKTVQKEESKELSTTPQDLKKQKPMENVSSTTLSPEKTKLLQVRKEVKKETKATKVKTSEADNTAIK